MYLWQPGFTYSASRPFTKNQRMNPKIYWNWRLTIYLSKWTRWSLFSTWHDYGDCKDLTRKTASDKILYDKAFNFDKNPKYDGYQRGLAWVAYNFFDRKTSCSDIKNENISNKKLSRRVT